MLFSGQRNEEFKFVDHGRPITGSPLLNLRLAVEDFVPIRLVRDEDVLLDRQARGSVKRARQNGDSAFPVRTQNMALPQAEQKPRSAVSDERNQRRLSALVKTRSSAAAEVAAT